jgi:hypothetical protein
MGRLPPAAVGLLLLGLLNGCLLTAIVTWAIGDNGEEPPVVEPAPRWTKLADAPPAARPIDKYKLILAHPVFFRNREPFVAAPTPTTPPPPKATPAPVVDPGLMIGGVFISERVRKVYLLTKNTSGGEWKREGESFMGWTVQSVEPSGAKLKQQDRTLELPLYPRN